MISTGAELLTFINSLNAEAEIDATLLDVLVDNAKAILEEERPWMVLRRVDTSKTVTTSNTWQTAIDLSTITDFNRFYGEDSIRLFDGGDRVEYYQLVPFDRRLEYKDVSYTACYDEYNKTLYLNGTLPFNGTLYLSILTTSTAISLTSESAVWTKFPSRFLPILGYYAIGIYKGAVDYDDINRQMLPENARTLQAMKKAMEVWDDEKQQNSLQYNDPTSLYNYPRERAINRHE